MTTGAAGSTCGVGNATFAFVLAGARAGTAVAINWSPNYGRIPLGDCTAWLAPPYSSAPATTDPLGAASFPVAIPNQPAVVGLELFVQFSVLDGPAPRPVTLSDALAILVGA